MEPFGEEAGVAKGLLDSFVVSVGRQCGVKAGVEGQEAVLPGVETDCVVVVGHLAELRRGRLVAQ